VTFLANENFPLDIVLFRLVFARPNGATGNSHL